MRCEHTALAHCRSHEQRRAKAYERPVADLNGCGLSGHALVQPRAAAAILVRHERCAAGNCAVVADRHPIREVEVHPVADVTVGPDGEVREVVTSVVDVECVLETHALANRGTEGT